MSDELQRIDPAKRQVFNGVEVSFGIAPILSTLGDVARWSHKPNWTTYLFNVETIIRDRKEKDTTQMQIARGVLTDCTVLAQYVAAYCRHTLPAKMKVRPVVCFYLPHYETIPQQYLREKLPKGTEERWEIRQIVENILQDEGFPTRFEETDVKFDIPEYKKGGRWPHKELMNELASDYGGMRYNQTLLISHVPLDFHLYRAVKDLTLVESFTGALKTSRDFGKKVFNEEEIPFNKYTHLLLGDKWYLRSQVRAAEKRKIKEVAKKERWHLLPEKAIAESIVKHKFVDPSIILDPQI